MTTPSISTPTGRLPQCPPAAGNHLLKPRAAQPTSATVRDSFVDAPQPAAVRSPPSIADAMTAPSARATKPAGSPSPHRDPFRALWFNRAGSGLFENLLQARWRGRLDGAERLLDSQQIHGHFALSGIDPAAALLRSMHETMQRRRDLFALVVDRYPPQSEKREALLKELDSLARNNDDALAHSLAQTLRANDPVAFYEELVSVIDYCCETRSDGSLSQFLRLLPPALRPIVTREVAEAHLI